MKNTPILTLFVAIGLLLFSSCKESQIQTYTPEILTGEDFFLSYHTPDILFSYLQVDEASQKVSGWFVDDRGVIHDVDWNELPVDVLDSEVSKNKMKTFQTIGKETESKVDLTILSNYYKKTRDLLSMPYLLDSENPTAPVTTYILAYDLSYDDQACDDCPGSTVSLEAFNQYLLKSEGTLNGQILGGTPREISTWMKELNSGL